MISRKYPSRHANKYLSCLDKEGLFTLKVKQKNQSKLFHREMLQKRERSARPNRGLSDYT